MAQIKGKFVIDDAAGVFIEVHERALAALLQDGDFEAQRGDDGSIGSYRGIPVSVRRHRPRVKK